MSARTDAPVTSAPDRLTRISPSLHDLSQLFDTLQTRRRLDDMCAESHVIFLVFIHIDNLDFPRDRPRLRGHRQALGERAVFHLAPLRLRRIDLVRVAFGKLRHRL